MKINVTDADRTDESLEREADGIWTDVLFAGNPPSLMEPQEREFWIRVAKYVRGVRAEGRRSENDAFLILARAVCHMNERLFKLLGLPTSELEDADPEGVEVMLTDAIRKLMSERDAARAKERHNAYLWICDNVGKAEQFEGDEP